MPVPDFLSPLIGLLARLAEGIQPLVGEVAARPTAALILIEAGVILLLPWLILVMNGRIRIMLKRQDHLEQRLERDSQTLQVVRTAVSDMAYRTHVLQTAVLTT